MYSDCVRKEGLNLVSSSLIQIYSYCRVIQHTKYGLIWRQNEKIQNSLSPHQKFLLGVGPDDEIFEEKVFGVGDYYRKNFGSEGVSETHK